MRFSFEFERSKKTSNVQVAETEKANVQVAERVINSSTYRGGEEYFDFQNAFKLNQLENFNNADKALFYFKAIPEVFAISSYVSRLCANIPAIHVVKSVKGEETEVKNSPFVSILNKPNEYEGGISMLTKAFNLLICTGNVYLNPIIPIGFSEPTKVYCLPSNKVYIITNNSSEPYGILNNGVDPRANEILKYNWDIDGTFKVLMPEDVIHIKDNSIDNWLYGESRLTAAIQSCETLKGLNTTLNNILAKGGALGFVKKNTKTGQIDTGIDPDEKQSIEKNFYQYNTDKKGHIFFTGQDISYQRILSQLSDFMPIEVKQSEFKTLCMAMGGLPDVIFYASESTFSNLDKADLLTYNNVVMPIVDLFYESYTSQFQKLGLISENEEIKADYSKIDCLQDDIKTKAESMKVNDEVARLRYDNNEITLNEKLNMLGLQSIKNGDLLKKDLPQTSITLAEKIGVGGTQAMQSILADQSMSQNQKKWALIYLFGLDEQQANNLSVNNTIQQ